MPLVASHELREMPGSRTGRVMIWNGTGSAEEERDGPLPWRVHYSLRRVWDHHLKTASIEDLRRILVTTSNGKMDDDIALIDLYRHHRRYTVQGEPSDPRDVVFGAAAERVMRDDKRSLEDRCAGASVLWPLGRQRDTVEVLLGMPSSREVIGLLVGTGTSEPRAVPKAFEFLEEVIRRKPGSLYERFLAADLVGRVLEPALSGKSRFAPDMRDWSPRVAGRLLVRYRRQRGRVVERAPRRVHVGSARAAPDRRSARQGRGGGARTGRSRGTRAEIANASADGAVAPRDDRHGRHLLR